MSLKSCPLCGYRYNAPENQTCGKCKGWLGGAAGSPGVAIVAAPPRRSLVPRSLPEFACYLPVLAGATLGWPNPIGAAFGLLMASLLIKVVRLDMERFSKGLLLGIVVGGIFFVYLLFLLFFNTLYLVLQPVLQPLVGRAFRH